MSNEIKEATVPAAGWGRLTCAYRSRQMPPALSQASFQRKIPKSVRTRRTRSVAIVERTEILVRRTCVPSHIPKTGYAVVSTTPDKVIQKTQYWVNEEIDTNYK
jgi:hypothetical protein